MNKDSLNSITVSDIIFRVSEILDMMRHMPVNESSEFISGLNSFIRRNFAEGGLNESQLRQLATALTDQMYIEIMRSNQRDTYTDGYFGIVVNSLFWELAQKNVRIFYVLDNHLRDDRFKIVAELFNSSHFSVIYPYDVKELDYGDSYTTFPTLDYKTVENQISNCIEMKKNILYIEKDDSVNYLDDVPRIPNKYRSEYAYLFRNESPF